MKLIIGLGNPGKKYEKTRHNIGFMIVEQFLKDFEPINKTVWENSEKFKSDIVHLDWQPRQGPMKKVILAKPKTYMNNSGLAVELLTSYFKLPSSDVWVVHDDIDLFLGSMRIRFGGGSAGNHGVESIMQTLNTDTFWRFRMGIGHPKKVSSSKYQVSSKNIEDYVLGGFTGPDKGKIKHLIKHGSDALQMALEQGMEASMNRYNTK